MAEPAPRRPSPPAMTFPPALLSVSPVASCVLSRRRKDDGTTCRPDWVTGGHANARGGTETPRSTPRLANTDSAGGTAHRGTCAWLVNSRIERGGHLPPPSPLQHWYRFMGLALVRA